MRTRLAGWSQVKQAMERNISTATVSNIVRRKCWFTRGSSNN